MLKTESLYRQDLAHLTDEFGRVYQELVADESDWDEAATLLAFSEERYRYAPEAK
jgi:hypothetical protein